MKKYNLQIALHNANKERALIYLDIFREIRKRHGEEEAVSILRNSLEKRGRQFGSTLKQYAPRDFRALCDAFAYAPDGGDMFQPIVLHCDESSLELKMKKCPLKEAWVEAGISDREISLLLQCASAMDVGTMDEAGFNLDIQTSKPGTTGCCYLKITAKTIET